MASAAHARKDCSVVGEGRDAVWWRGEAETGRSVASRWGGGAVALCNGRRTPGCGSNQLRAWDISSPFVSRELFYCSY
eukprot:GDKH01011899.1.p3 GENE.GDKH01011899.1~~GDKH01011899.1.p3  ORF type:complete len:78 (+),score=6.20 GDKH01011899.1:470-703(+)